MNCDLENIQRFVSLRSWDVKFKMQTHDVLETSLCWWTVYIFGNEFIKTVFFKMFSTKFPTLQVEGSIAVSSQGAIYMGLYEGFSNVTLALCKWFMIFFSPDFLLLNCKKTGYFIPSEINLHTLCIYHLNPNGYDFLGMRIWRPDALNTWTAKFFLLVAMTSLEEVEWIHITLVKTRNRLGRIYAYRRYFLIQHQKLHFVLIPCFYCCFSHWFNQNCVRIELYKYISNYIFTSRVAAKSYRGVTSSS